MAGSNHNEQPARKRRKLSTGSAIGSEDDSTLCSERKGDTMDTNHLSMQKILGEEFDLEISLRQRMIGLIESKITLALLLRDSLFNNNGASEAAVSHIGNQTDALPSQRHRRLLQLSGYRQ
jgi:hypothetical protein